MKTIALLDVNVLIAAAWPAHNDHGKVQDWLGRHARDGWATCPLTELGFVRILSNPGFSPHALTPRDAMALLRANLTHPAHQFWPDELDLAGALEPSAARITGHQQLADAYLLGLAIIRKGKLVTLDQSVRALLSNKAVEQDHLQLI